VERLCQEALQATGASGVPAIGGTKGVRAGPGCRRVDVRIPPQQRACVVRDPRVLPAEQGPIQEMRARRQRVHSRM
jgi:hypothetical protein